MNVTVVGLGKLGCPYAALLAKRHDVLGVDINQHAVEQINVGEPPVDEPGLAELLRGDRLRATVDFEEAAVFSDTWVFVLPTPSDEVGAYDYGAIVKAIDWMGDHAALGGNHMRPQTVIIKSTVSPGTCAGPITEALRAYRDDARVVYNPEFIALGEVIFGMERPDVLLVGVDDNYRLPLIVGDSMEVAAPILGMGLTEAEIAKVALNAYITMKISYANSIAELCDAYGVRSTPVLDAVGRDSRVGTKYLKAGPPFAGPCFPRDNKALQRAAHERGVTMPLAAATDAVNVVQVDRMVARLRGVGHNEKIAILGLGYKAGVAISDEAPGLQLAAALRVQGYTHVVTYDHKTMTDGSFGSIAETVDHAAAVVLATNDPAWSRLRGRPNVIDWWAP